MVKARTSDRLELSDDIYNDLALALLDAADEIEREQCADDSVGGS